MRYGPQSPGTARSSSKRRKSHNLINVCKYEILIIYILSRSEELIISISCHAHDGGGLCEYNDIHLNNTIKLRFDFIRAAIRDS